MDKQVENAFQTFVPIILSNERLTSIGRQLVSKSAEQNYSNYRQVIDYVSQHDISSNKQLGRIFVLCGASRTGSTLLYNLLAQDPKSRAPTLFDMNHPIPPHSRSDTFQQQQTTTTTTTSVEVINYEKERNASHPSFEYEEDVLILHHAGLFMPFLEPEQSRTISDWFYDRTNKDFLYEYHRIFLQMLNNVDRPESHWILKSPHHIYNLDALLRQYPSACLVMTHRQLEQVVPSSIRLALSFASIYFEEKKQQTVIDRRLHMTDVQLDRIVEFRQNHSEIPVYDIFYDDLVNDPISTLQRFYEHFQLEWSNQFQEKVEQWLIDNPQGKQGRNIYSLEEFQLTKQQIQQRYHKYNQMFFPSCC